MFKGEFERLAGWKVESHDYYNYILPMWKALKSKLTKPEFVRTVSRNRFELLPMDTYLHKLRRLSCMCYEMCNFYDTSFYEMEMQTIAKSLSNAYFHGAGTTLVYLPSANGSGVNYPAKLRINGTREGEWLLYSC